jgi:hypothetical protein
MPDVLKRGSYVSSGQQLHQTVERRAYQQPRSFQAQAGKRCNDTALPRGAFLQSRCSGYANIFWVIIMAFMDAHAFDVRSVKKSCVHIVHPDDHRLIPFDTYNLFYRDELEQRVLTPLRTGRSAPILLRTSAI